MKKRTFIMNILFNYILAVVFVWIAIDHVTEFGWGFFSIIFVFFATSDFVRATRMLDVYFKIKKSNKS